MTYGAVCEHGVKGKSYCRRCVSAYNKMRYRANHKGYAPPKTHCKSGLHEFTEENTLWFGGRRRCRACELARKKLNNWGYEPRYSRSDKFNGAGYGDERG